MLHKIVRSCEQNQAVLMERISFTSERNTWKDIAALTCFKAQAVQTTLPMFLPGHHKNQDALLKFE